jgi:hypothetical protein
VPATVPPLPGSLLDDALWQYRAVYAWLCTHAQLQKLAWLSVASAPGNRGRPPLNSKERAHDDNLRLFNLEYPPTMSSIDPSSVQTLSCFQMYNRVNCDPMILDFRPLSEYASGHFVNCDRIDLDTSDQELNAIVKEQIESMKDNNNHCILLLAQSDWVVHSDRILAALALSPLFRRYHRCHCVSETLSFAPFLATEDVIVGVPSLVECLLPARVFLSGIFHASPFMATQLQFGRVVNVTPDVPRLIDLTASFPIVDSSAVDIGPVLEKTRPIIAACVRDNVPILIHCHAGVSRSASVVIDYVASTFQISANEAIERVRQSRSIIEPNEGFMAKLQELYPPI